MHWGNSKWKQRPREEQAEADGTEDVEKVAHLLGVDAAELIKGLLKPRIKVNNKFRLLSQFCFNFFLKRKLINLSDTFFKFIFLLNRSVTNT